MEERIDRTPVDRTGWGPGPWDGEPDRVEFEHAGLPCLMLRQPRTGHWCGYAAVPPGHPMHGVTDVYDLAPELDVDVHGGLTYSGLCDGTHICHTPKPGEPADVWWLGFDCAHAGDLSPIERRYQTESNRKYPFDRDHGVYRDVAYVRNQVMRLAEQLSAR